jgi:predicted ArsR family transcriptional regulator
MPKPRRYNLAELWVWIWLQDNGVTARQIAEHLGCPPDYVRRRVLLSLEMRGYFLAQTGQQKTGRRLAAVYSPMRPDENDREKF